MIRVISAIAAVFAGLACLVFLAMPAMADSDASPAPEQVGSSPALPMQSEPIRAQLRAREEATLAAGLAAKINELPFQEGDSFEQGEVLVAFDCSQEEAEMAHARGELSAAAATLNTNNQLAELNSISTLELKTSRAAVVQAQARVDLMESRLSACVEHAPFPGKVDTLEVKQHQRVAPGDILMTILNPMVLEVDLMVPSRWLRWLSPGTSFSLLVDETGREYKVVVASIGARVDPVSQTVKIIGELEIGEELILPGMSGYATFDIPPDQQPN